MMSGFRLVHAWKMGLVGFILLTTLGCKPSFSLPSPAPTVNTYGLSKNAFTTLNSLEKVDDHPLYVMHYAGGYVSPRRALRQDLSSFACSLFAALGDKDHLLYGRNFDWTTTPALLLYTDPPDGYASVSMVDLLFTGLDPGTISNLMEIPVTERTPILETLFIPIDGMNEYGVTIGMAAVDESAASHDLFKRTISSLGIMREVLDHARNTDEAQAIFSRYNIDFTGGPTVHYLVADSRGKSILIEFVDGSMTVLPNEKPWHLATNHLVAGGLNGVGNSGWRYGVIEARLSSSGGILTPADAMHLLETVSQRWTQTQWSVIYNSSQGSIDVVISRNYTTVHSFQLEMAGP